MIVLFILLPAGIAVVGIIIVAIYGVLDCLDYFCYKEEHEESTERERLVDICVVSYVLSLVLTIQIYVLISLHK